MRKLKEVQEAKELMSEAIDWSTFKWLLQKPRVRETADRANDALDRLERTVKVRWSDQLKAAAAGLSAEAASSARRNEKRRQSIPVDPQIKLLVEKVKEADDAARRAKMEAEKTFDEAERQMSTSLAREGSKQAIRSWELREKAIRLAESVLEEAKAG